MKNTPDTYTFHLENGLDITVEEYARAKRIGLGRDVLGRHRVYLDTKYWVLLRDVFMGRPRRPIHREILDSLSAALESGQVICPVSYSVYVELLEQRDDKTRSAMAELIDILSLGVCTQPPHELAKSELFRFFCKHTSPASELLEFGQLAWTKVGFIVGDVFLDAELPQIWL